MMRTVKTGIVIILASLCMAACHHGKKNIETVSREDSLLSEEFRIQGIKYALGGNLVTALEVFNQALEHNPNNAAAYGGRGMVYLGFGDLEEAFNDASRAIDLDPGNADWWGNRAHILKKKGDLEEALKDINQSVKTNPGYSWAYLERGHVLLLMGKTPEACRNWEQAARLGEPSAPDSLLKYCK